jgi:hypothetical protein
MFEAMTAEFSGETISAWAPGLEPAIANSRGIRLDVS